MFETRPLMVALSTLLGAASLVMAQEAPPGPSDEVEAVERAFAQSMADRDFATFQSFLAQDAVFLGGGGLRGKNEVAQGWRRYFEGPEAPFSWYPETVEVLDSGSLALSTGPVFDAAGARISTFTSIWRREADGMWRIVFDRGNKYCE